MAYINQCPFCKTILETSDPRCPKCGAENMFYGVDMSGDAYQNPRPIQEAEGGASVPEKRSPAPSVSRPATSSTGKCPHCGSTLRSDQKTCPNCGARNEHFVLDTSRTIYDPKTIEELKEYCAERGMPLLRMRFFIGEDYKAPKAFGIYRDGKNVVVYKNKADGSRAVRYRGTDEAHAVNELFQKLLSECHNRGIYPDGKPVTRSGGASTAEVLPRKSKLGRIILAALGVLLLTLLLLKPIRTALSHRGDGYYKYAYDILYYKNGEVWSYTSDHAPDGSWTSYPNGLIFSKEVLDGQDPYLGKEYQDSWGYSPYSWDRDTRNAQGYYDFGDGNLYYMSDTHNTSRNHDYYQYFYTSQKTPGVWYSLGKVSLFCGERPEYSDPLTLADGSSAPELRPCFLGRSYQAEWGFCAFDNSLVKSVKTGYYDFGDGQLYYRDRRGSWHHTASDIHDHWHNTGDSSVLFLDDGSSAAPDAWDSAYLGSSWDSDWGGTSYFSSSDSDSWSSSDYDSWDSSDTDWDSDW